MFSRNREDVSEGDLGKRCGMTEKELHRLKRHDLLQLLLAQGREAAQLQARIDEMGAELEELQNANTRFIERLNDKDIQIGKLKERLDEKDAQMEKFKERLNEKDAQIERLKGRLNEKDAQTEKFKERLNEKDGQIERLKGRLGQKDERISSLEQEKEEYRSGRIFEMDEILSLTVVGQKLEGIFASAQKAVEEYLEGAQKKADGDPPKGLGRKEDSLDI